MKYLDVNLTTPELNLACDEALLDWCEQGMGCELLRVWESLLPFVVVGYANQVEREVHRAVCDQEGIPILRRCTGGGTVVQGPGCVNYSLLLRVDEAGPLATITGANHHVMERHREALQAMLHSKVTVCGHTDLALGPLKFSGNAQRRRRQFLLFHGTFLLEFDLPLIERLLPMPSKQPGYRGDRAHTGFLTNIPLSRDALTQGLREAWGAKDLLDPWPSEETRRMADSKYGRDDWNFRF